MLTAPQITTGEKLLLDRRRRGETKAAAAERFGVSLYRYASWETDKSSPSSSTRLPRLGRLKDHEGSFLIRRRAGVSVGRFAKLAGVSAWWLTKMERGQASTTRLRMFWEPLQRRAKSPERLLAALLRKAG